jgi:hypothetical protein
MKSFVIEFRKLQKIFTGLWTLAAMLVWIFVEIPRIICLSLKLTLFLQLSNAHNREQLVMRWFGEHQAGTQLSCKT